MFDVPILIGTYFLAAMPRLSLATLVTQAYPARIMTRDQENMIFEDDVRHVVLAGDSIFDNDGYVIGEPGVIEQMRRALPSRWSASKIAVDGDCIADVAKQIEGIPSNATDLVLSVGGNDARRYRGLLDRVESVSELPKLLVGPLSGFRNDYRALLQTLSGLDLQLTVCTIYTDIPFEGPLWRQYAPLAIGAFNVVILDEAKRAKIPVLRLETVCVEDTDFSTVSPIEPSCTGGQKIVDHIIATLSDTPRAPE